MVTIAAAEALRKDARTGLVANLYHSTWTLKKDAQRIYYYWPPSNIPHAKSGWINFDIVEPRPGEYRLTVVALAKKQPRYAKTFAITVDEPSS